MAINSMSLVCKAWCILYERVHTSRNLMWNHMLSNQTIQEMVICLKGKYCNFLVSCNSFMSLFIEWYHYQWVWEIRKLKAGMWRSHYQLEILRYAAHFNSDLFKKKRKKSTFKFTLLFTCTDPFRKADKSSNFLLILYLKKQALKS